jgi:DtxR family transcriptional regulator, Mn-dependent transcriptional regulator
VVPTTTVENYLKALYNAQQRAGGALVPMGAVANAMNVVPGTATSMIKALAESGLVEYEPRGGVKLTPKGEGLALHVLRRHRLIELFLVEVLRMDWSEVDAEAEELEHAVSDKVLERIDELLGRPEVDPHGDPIPNPSGQMQPRQLEGLSSCPIGQAVKIAQVLDQHPQFLQFVDRHGLKPGTRVTVERRDDISDAVVIQTSDGRHLPLGTGAANKILLEVEQQ